ncbi:UNVERIFIED_CONTAM: hypothetical protein HDU68_000694 [Siphonaria sp. JEL0065]|nr:hypothetical protein HDU68_000694 [Siphonaria sp. JEL0065]
MKFQTQIILRLILPIVIGFILIGFSAILVFFLRVPPQIDTVQAQLQSSELAHFSSNAKGAATLVNNIFNDFGDQVAAAATMARNLLNLDGSAQDPLVNSTSVYPSYFAGQLDGADPILPPNPTDFSVYYNNNITTVAQFNAMQPDPISVLDNVFRAAVLYEPRIKSAQIGFLDGGWRIYPLRDDLASFNPRNNTFCNGQNVPATLRGATGFIPQCRQFYIAATNAYPPTQPAPVTGMTKPVITNPYPSAISGQLLIAAAVSLYRGGSFFGVFTLTILVESLSSKLANTPILNNGYIYIIEKDGTVIMYPQSRTTVNIYNADATVNLAAVEFNNNTALFSTFLGQVKAMTDKDQTGTYIKDNGQLWTFAAATVAATSHILVVTAPNSDIDALADTMRRSYVRLLAASLTVTILITLLAACISYWTANRLAIKIMKPIDDMIKRLGEIRDNKLGFEFEDKPLLSKELDSVNKNFRNLLIAVRFGNEAYYAGNLDVALNNYLAAELLMIRLENLRGLGVCANNLGNVYRQQEEFQKAVSSYDRAVKNGMPLNTLGFISKSIRTAILMLKNTTQTDLQTQTALNTVLAHRLNNIGVLFKDHGDFAEAERYLDDSLALHLKTDNIEGIALVSGNLGQLYLAQNKLDKAEAKIEDALSRVLERNDNAIAIQYACLNMGLLCEAQKNFGEAVNWYLYVLTRFKAVVKDIQRNAVQQLIALCEETDPAKGANRPALAESFKKLSEPLLASYSSTKNITFVLDVSGSMGGTFINACRASIKDIINNHCNLNDNISLVKFNDFVAEVFSNRSKRVAGHMEDMMYLIDNNTNAYGRTAFYDAINFTLRQILTGPNTCSNTWVIALTDGDDCASSPISLQNIKQVLQENRNIGVIVITVGTLSNERVIRQMLEDVGNNKGFLIRSEENTNGIQEAFGRAVRMMQGGVNVENL